MRPRFVQRMNCKNCQQTIPENVQGKFCPYCGAALSEPSAIDFQPDASTAPADSSPAFSFAPANDPAPEYYVHWEDRARLGFLRAFSQTWSEVTFRPTEFFQKASPLGHFGSALLFAFLMGMVSSLISLFWQYQFWGSFSEMEQFKELFGFDLGRDFLKLAALFSPFVIIISIFFASFIFHVSLLLTGSGRSGWEATFRAICYSYGPRLFDCIPWCGGLIAGVWQFVVMLIGWREMHNSSTARVVLAAFLPFLFCCALVLVLVYQFAAFFNKSGFNLN